LVSMSSVLAWLPGWLGLSYAKLYHAFGEELFTFRQATQVTHSGNPKLVLSLLRRKGWVTVFRREGRNRYYRLLKPDHAMNALALGASIIPKQGRYANLLSSVIKALTDHYKNGLSCVAVFGSVGRGTANPDSDVDVLTVAEFRGDAASRIDELAGIEWSGEIERELMWLRAHGVRCHISWFPLTPEEAARFRPLYLDMTEDATVVYDRGHFLAGIFRELRNRLEREGGKRVWLDKDRWYWTLSPDIGGKLVAAV